MKLNNLQSAMLAGDHGPATRKAMEILVGLGEIYGAERMIPISSAQVAGVSYDNLGEAGLHFLAGLADGGGRARVLTTLNPAGMDLENRAALGIPAEFAAQQARVIDAFARMGVVTTCTCTPYLVGNLPRFGEHIAWAESSAVCYANAVIGARTNREGGPSALAAALTGFTPAYGLHLPDNRRPTLTVRVQAAVTGPDRFGALGKAVGEQAAARGTGQIPYLTGIENASLEDLKSFCASLATYGGTAMFHIAGITPEAALHIPPTEEIVITSEALESARAALTSAAADEVDFVSLGCPHLTISEIGRLAALLEGKQVQRTFWITTARQTKRLADQMGYTQIIEGSGAVFAADTCCVVAPIRGRFHALATDSAKACYYAAAKNRMQTVVGTFEEVVALALKPRGAQP